MKYTERLPSDHIKDIVQNYWTFEVPENPDVVFPISHETLPENTLSLVLINQPYFKGVRLLGPHTKKYSQSLVPNAIFLGIKLQPWITIHAFDICKTQILNATTDTSAFVQNQFKDMDVHMGFDNFEALDKQVSHFLNGVDITKNDMVKFICLELNNGKPILDIISKIPVSTRVIQKKFKETTGITMKQYASINRQRNTWKAIILENKNTLDAVLDNGFFDQSHFINEFKKIMNRSHSDFQTYLTSVKMTFQ